MTLNVDNIYIILKISEFSICRSWWQSYASIVNDIKQKGWKLILKEIQVWRALLLCWGELRKAVFCYNMQINIQYATFLFFVTYFCLSLMYICTVFQTAIFFHLMMLTLVFLFQFFLHHVLYHSISWVSCREKEFIPVRPLAWPWAAERYLHPIYSHLTSGEKAVIEADEF